MSAIFSTAFRATESIKAAAFLKGALTQLVMENDWSWTVAIPSLSTCKRPSKLETACKAKDDYAYV